jgi:hypothetical protein
MPDRKDYDYLNTLSPFGGNQQARREKTAARGAYRPMPNARTATPEEIEEYRQYVESTHNVGHVPGYDQRLAMEGAIDDWAQAGQSALGMQAGSNVGIDQARKDILSNRDAQLQLLDLVDQARADTTAPASTMARDDLLKQAALAQARGIDPGLALTGASRAGGGVAQGAMASRAGEAQARQAALQEGSHGIRGSDLSRAQLEMQTLEGDLAWQQSKENLNLQNLQGALNQIGSAREAEVALADIAAGGPGGFDFADHVLPGLTQMASLGLMGLGSMESGKSSATAPWWHLGFGE